MGDTNSVTTDIERRNIWLGVRIIVEFGVEIAAPAIFGAWLGRRFGTDAGHPRLGLALGLLAAFILTAIVISKRAQAYGREYEALNAPKKNT